MADPRSLVVKGSILVVDDEESVRELVRVTLEMEGYEVTTASDGMQAYHHLAERHYDLVLLDLMMPVIGGLEVLDTIRRDAATPVIVLTALSAEDNKVRGLQLGADDYVVKPFSPRELSARVEAVLRRAAPDRRVGNRLAFDGLSIDIDGREVWVGGHRIELTAKEFDLLAFLAARPGKVFSRSELLREVWHSSSAWQQEGTVTEHVRRLRTKIEDDPENPKFLMTVRGVGYRFERRADERPVVVAYKAG